MIIFKNHKLCTKKGERLSVFVRKLERDMLEFYILRCSRNDQFNKKISNSVYDAYLESGESFFIETKTFRKVKNMAVTNGKVTHVDFEEYVIQKQIDFKPYIITRNDLKPELESIMNHLIERHQFKRFVSCQLVDALLKAFSSALGGDVLFEKKAKKKIVLKQLS